MTSERLRYRRVDEAGLAAFHRLVTDDHVRRYLMDGTIVPREWSAERIRDSQALFLHRGVGLWLAHHETTNELVGFCGFLVMPAVHPQPQLVYAIFERFTGKGYATEMARAAIAEASTNHGFTEIVAAVDEVNVASRRVLDKIGFVPMATTEGAFGSSVLCLLRVP
jgi:RimJ/RimL family protein N-acetyltransferase